MTSFEPGGTERQMIELIRRLDPQRWTPHVACFRASGSWFGRVAQSVASVTEFPIDSFQSTEAARQLAAFVRWCRERQIAVLHTAEMPANIFALPGGMLAGVTVRIGNRREINPGRSVAGIAAQRAAYACAHAVVANSLAAAERLAYERVPTRKIRVIPNGLEASTFNARTPRAPLRRVITVANLRPEKGHDVLIEAAALVLRRYPDAHFDIVGDGPQRTSLIARADEAGVSHAMTFLGHRDDVAARLEASDVFVLPSRSEAFPNAVLEAMAAGLPIVASGVGGIREVIDHEHTGLLVPPDDSQALAERICRLMADAPLALRIATSARARAQARYSFDRMVASFEALYASELARRGVLQAGAGGAPGVQPSETIKAI